jgi:hypothetical protein
MHQLELFTRQVAIEITNDKGHTIKYLEPGDALIFIQEYCESMGMWAYVDGLFVKSKQLNTSMLTSAEKIYLTYPIVGG